MSLAVVTASMVILLGLLSSASGQEYPEVFFSPGTTMLDVDDTLEVSFRVGSSCYLLSGYQLYLSFDPEVVELTSATEGSLYVLSGYTTWFIPEEEAPGQWHFFDTVMGVGTHIVPPGELLHLEFRALDYGSTEIHIDSILLADENRNNLPVGGYEHAHIFVVSLTGADESGSAGIGRPYPNPFVTRTRVPIRLERGDGPVSAEIHDVAGRLVRRITVGCGVTEGEIVWDGTDDRGREVTSAVYYLRVPGYECARCRIVKID
jgi:hypothetical protein